MINVVDTVAVDSPLAALDALTSQGGAAAFRDIKAYTTYDVRGRNIRVSYASGIPFAAPIRMTLRLLGGRVEFSGTGPLGMRVEGDWTVRGDGTARLEQRVHAPPCFEPLVRRRVARALQDLQRAAARTQA
jgi:hypothetical protein